MYHIVIFYMLAVATFFCVPTDENQQASSDLPGYVPDQDSLMAALDQASDPRQLMNDILETTYACLPDDPSTAKLTPTIFDLLEQYKLLQWPVHDPDTSPPRQMIQRLQKEFIQPQTAMLNYFWGTRHIFVFVVHANGCNVKKIPLNAPLSDNLNRVLFHIQQFDPNLEIPSFVGAIKHLTNALLPDSIPSHIKELVVLPDGPLYQLSFDILLRDTILPEEAKTFNRLPFLIQRYAISYSYASSPLLYDHGQESPFPSIEHPFFSGFAPSFDKQARQHPEICTDAVLSCNEKEIRSIARFFSGQLFLGKQASLKNMTSYGIHTPILHIATHSCLQTDGLHLQDTTLSHLPLLNPGVTLVVLSACHTARVREHNSMVHTFIASGVPAAIGSLWALEDCIAPVLMSCFYEALSLGFNKSAALQLAKCNFLRSAGKTYQHPYFWAGFISLGQQIPLVKKRKCPNPKAWLLPVLHFLLKRFYQYPDFVQTVENGIRPGYGQLLQGMGSRGDAQNQTATRIAPLFDIYDGVPNLGNRPGILHVKVFHGA